MEFLYGLLIGWILGWVHEVSRPRPSAKPDHRHDSCTNSGHGG